MIKAEFVRNLNCNYERFFLEQNPEENRYQYCIVTRGGIKEVLPCSLRYINKDAYLYYDISSTQSVAALYRGRSIPREWLKDFLWSMDRVYQEMDRFLLDDRNILWYPDQIFQDLEQNSFFFIYFPYYQGDTGFPAFLDYLVEHIDYDDETLVECVYRIYEQYNLLGEGYLRTQIHEDSKMLDVEKDVPQQTEEIWEQLAENAPESSDESETTAPKKDVKKGIRYFLGGFGRKQGEARNEIYRQTGQMMAGYAVCENTGFDVSDWDSETGDEGNEEENDEKENYGRTVYLEEAPVEKKNIFRLFTEDGKLLTTLEGNMCTIGKKKEEADCVISDFSISRIHARISRIEDEFYLEDLNSTNGTWLNGLRLDPYEKRKLEEEDEIRLGKIVLIFR